MKKLIVAATMILAATTAYADVGIGKPAPDFTAHAASGKDVKLSDYAGKIVVLEWNNPGCPFVKKFYGSGKMQELQAAAAKDGVVWLTVNSGAEGKQGYLTEETARQFIAEKKAAPTEYLLDHEGKIGHLYGAKTTPHMFVIDKKSTLVYTGAIDNKPSPNTGDIDSAQNYVSEALGALKDGRKVDVSSTQSYGCNVKY